jgi:hypothetical protein
MTARPSFRFALLTATLAGAAASGCDGGTNLTVRDGGGVDAPRATAADGGRRDTRSSTDLPTFEAAGDRPPPPPPSTEATVLVPGRARLVGTHFTACSNGTPQTGDRWCAFYMPNRQLGFTDLWVINVTKALAGAVPKCDGTDPNCKLMIPPGSDASKGTQLWTGQPMDPPAHPTTHRFDGDTLIFYALADAALEIYAGPIFAWRPGWDAPKQISMTKNAYSCTGHFSAEVFVCIENLSEMAPLTFDLVAGRLATGGKLVKKIVPARPGTQSSQWRATISRDGQYLIYSTGGMTIQERETLYVARFDNPETSTTVRAGASRWSISADQTKIYFLANYNYDTAGMPSGTLTMTNFPMGGAEQTLAANVGAIQPLAEGEIDRGIGFFDNVVAGKANYKIIKDRTKPTEVTTVVTNIGGVLGLSRDLKYVYFYKEFDMDTGFTDGYIVKTDGSNMPCALTETLTSDQFGAPFSRNGSQVFWVDNIDTVDGVGEGWTATPEGCTGKKKFSNRMDFWFLHGDNGMVFSDEGLADSATVKYMTFPNGNSTGPVTTIQPQVNRIYGILLNYESIIYNIYDAPADKDGLYSYAKIPFAGPIGGGADGGVRDARGN